MGPMLPSAAARSRSVMMAVMLGTAMTAGGDTVQAASRPNDHTIADINRYCSACWRNARLPADRWNDCTQQVFTRLLERVDPGKWSNVLNQEGSERVEFIRAIDAVKKRTQRDRKLAALSVDIADGRPHTDSLADEREAVAQAMQIVLSPRQKQIVELTVNGYGIPEIAQELNTTPERISDEKYKAIRKLRSYFGVV